MKALHLFFTCLLLNIHSSSQIEAQTPRELTSPSALISNGFILGGTGSNGQPFVPAPTFIYSKDSQQSFATSTCPNNPNKIIRLTGVTDVDKAAILNAHNHFRSIVAQGLAPGQLGATDMLEMVWDSSLSSRSDDWLYQCNFGHDSGANRATITFQTTGQCIAMTATTGGGSKYNMTTYVQMWYNEVNLLN
jgi:hypothetical protein